MRPSSNTTEPVEFNQPAIYSHAPSQHIPISSEQAFNPKVVRHAQAKSKKQIRTNSSYSYNPEDSLGIIPIQLQVTNNHYIVIKNKLSLQMQIKNFQKQRII